MEYIIELAGTDSNKKKLCEYKEAFIVYAQHRVFECPCQFGAKCTPDDTVKLDSNYQCQLSELKEFHIRLCRILNVHIYRTRLISVEKGCFKLLFVLPQHIQASTFPFSKEQEKELEHLHVLQLSCGSYHFNKRNIEVHLAS